MAKFSTLLFAIFLCYQTNGYNKDYQDDRNMDHYYYLEKYYPTVFLDLKTTEKIRFSDASGDIKILNNDPENERFIKFTILQKIDNQLQVIAWDSYDLSFIGLGSISASAPLYIYVYKCHHFNGETRLFDTPDYDGSYRIIPDQTEARVVDVSDKWLKVELSEGNNISSGWVPFEEQCSEVYTTCS